MMRNLMQWWRLRRDHRKALIDAESRYRELFQGIPIGLYQTSPNGRFMEVNQAMVNMLGYPDTATLMALPTRNLYASDDDHALWLTTMQRYGFVKDLVVRMSRFDGGVIWVEINGKQVYKDGELAFHEGSLQDVTDRIRGQQELKAQVEEEVQRALRQEARLAELRAQFVTMTSHEFRTPLASILTSAELLEHYGANWPPEKVRTHLKRIQDGVSQITGLMDDILIVGRADAGKLVVAKEPVEMNPFLVGLIEEMRMVTRFSHPIDIIGTAGIKPVHADRKLVRQILVNLISNACKYSPAGNPVRVGVARTEDLIYLYVADQGAGIGADDLNLIFEPFFRAADTSDIPGTGLGLAIVKRSVEAHGGQISVESRLGEGTTFTLTLDVRP